MGSLRCRLLAAFNACLALFVAPVCAEESLHQRIDQKIAAGLANYDQLAAPLAGDAEFLRRITLDLTGRIPPAAETRAFLADKSSDKRTKLIDKLLASPEYARRMQEYFDVMLMDRRRDAKVPGAAWEEFLRTSFAANKPYDQLVREILSNDGADPKTRAAAKFFLERDLEPTIVTRDISRLFLGQNLQCAQCHDHPLVDDYHQEHFYGIQAFFNRAFLFPDAKDAKAVIAEKAEGEVSFISVFDPKKAQKSTPPAVPGWKPIGDPKLEKGKEYTMAPAKNVKPVPAYSRLSKLAAAITANENIAFRRTAANRLWAMMLGRGLVQPLDFDHSNNPPSHPQLMTMLADEFAGHHYDVKWLLREIALSSTYQRSSEGSPKSQNIPEHRYAVAILKPLSPEQIGYSMMQATGLTDVYRNELAKTLTEPTLQTKLAPNLGPFRQLYGAQPGEPEDGFASTLDQTLFVKHGNHVRNLIAPRTGSLVERAAKLAEPSLIAEELFLTVYSRLPADDERRELAELLRPAANRTNTLTEVVWAMLASAEFRFNH
ncbi:DUF1549 domain-containing protein [Zavarzinella formosa]|uniref:DUF1549 domain-containing protein n=1 Tax=Zavarzinella formosa TaxID=360055 RepID=UPI0003639DE3|nr:DUF1549 domain-containing protein [Zavarzinella formosa]